MCHTKIPRAPQTESMHKHRRAFRMSSGLSLLSVCMLRTTWSQKSPASADTAAGEEIKRLVVLPVSNSSLTLHALGVTAAHIYYKVCGSLKVPFTTFLPPFATTSSSLAAACSFVPSKDDHGKVSISDISRDAAGLHKWSACTAGLCLSCGSLFFCCCSIRFVCFVFSWYCIVLLAVSVLRCCSCCFVLVCLLPAFTLFFLTDFVVHGC